MTDPTPRSGAARPTAAPAASSNRVRPISSARSRRLSKRALRSIAWVGGGAAFLAAWAVIDVVPTPASSQASPVQTTPRRLVVIHHVVRKVIIQDRAPSGGGVTTSSGSGGVVYLPAPVSAPVVSSGGSHP